VKGTLVGSGSTTRIATFAADSISDTSEVETTVIVDNTAPVITSSIADGSEQRGEFTLDFEATDAGVGVASTSATFDGEKVESGTTFSSLTLAAGTHTLTIVSTDKLGNESKKTITFTTPVEQPSATLDTADGAGLNVCVDDSLSATATDPSKDDLSVSFREATRPRLAKVRSRALREASTTPTKQTARAMRSRLARQRQRVRHFPSTSSRPPCPRAPAKTRRFA
ncbi:MAG: hypothetical protein E6Z13_03570, partial [Dermabacter sp.]|nr:hypothetical protein [Dermabacter sp.]